VVSVSDQIEKVRRTAWLKIAMMPEVLFVASMIFGTPMPSSHAALRLDTFVAPGRARGGRGNSLARPEALCKLKQEVSRLGTWEARSSRRWHSLASVMTIAQCSAAHGAGGEVRDGGEAHRRGEAAHLQECAADASGLVQFDQSRAEFLAQQTSA
jgi:hypothetical protein